MIFRDNPVNLALDTPLYQQLYNHLRTTILSGDLKRGMKLPSTRALASQLNVSRNTVLNAYQQLMIEGYLESTVGNGTFVAQVLPDHLFTPVGPNDPTDTTSREPGVPRFSDHAKLQLEAPQLDDVTLWPQGASPRPFRFGVPALQVFPYKLWSRLVVRRGIPASWRGRATSLPPR